MAEIITPKKKSLIVLFLIALTLTVTLSGLSTLSVIDRDEARYAQASVQMNESGDYLNIRFQDEARNKKPAGIYWLQLAAMKTIGDPEERQIWVQRLPSVFGALIAVLATYFGGAKLVGRQAGFIAAGALALSMMMIFEGHIAKTDAVLCGLAALCFSAIAHIRSRPSDQPSVLSLWKARPAIWVFWLALGSSIMIKGPIIPSLVALCLFVLLIWEKRGYGIRQLVNIPAIIACLLLFIPWAIAIGVETNGAFFAESLGNDLGGKIISAQESHPGPFGYHLALISVTFWPSALFLLPAFVFAIQAVRRGGDKDSNTAKAVRLCLAWIIPFWILIEIMPTKLPHYSLPLFPALAILVGLVSVHLLKGKDLKRSRIIGGSLFLCVSAALIAGLIYAALIFSQSISIGLLRGVMSVAAIAALFAGFALWANKIALSLISAAICAVIVNVTAYGYILPSLSTLRLADRLEAGFIENNIALPRQGGAVLQSLNFTEPSLVYRFGKEVRLGDQIQLNNADAWRVGHLFIVDYLQNNGEAAKRFDTAKAARGVCTQTRFTVEGFNYSRGDEVDLRVIEVIPCE